MKKKYNNVNKFNVTISLYYNTSFIINSIINLPHNDKSWENKFIKNGGYLKMRHRGCKKPLKPQ